MSFTKVREEDYTKVVTTLESRLPKATMGYNVLQMKITGIHPPSTVTKVYAFAGNFKRDEENAFIVIIMQRQNTNDTSIIVSTPPNPTDEMTSALEKLVNWDNKVFFCAVDIAYSGKIIDMSKRRGNLDRASKCDFLYVPLDVARNIRDEDIKGTASQENLKISQLSPNDAKFVVDNWKFAYPGAEAVMMEQINCIGSAGVYSGPDSELVSCVSIFTMGSINALFTTEKVRGKGYGYLTMKKVCQVAGARGLIPNVQVEIGNTPSNKLMEKVGFIQSHEIEWVWYSPKKE